MNLDCTPETFVLTYFTGQNRPPKKLGVNRYVQAIILFYFILFIKLAEPQSPWDACWVTTILCNSLSFSFIVVVTVVVTEKTTDEKVSNVLNYRSSDNPIEIVSRDGKPVLVRWTSSELDSNSKTELMPDSSVGVRLNS